jgi:arylsulfatase A-like enzyme
LAPFRPSRIVLVFAALGGVSALAITWLGSITLGLATGLIVWLLGMGAAWWSSRHGILGPAHDPGRRRFLAIAGLGGLVWVAAGSVIGRAAAKLGRPDARLVQDEAAADLGSEYMELVQRAYREGRSGDLQLLVAPFNSANYPQESLSLVPQDPRTSHAAVWMYLERIPLVAYGPGIIRSSDSEERVTLADLAPTTAQLAGFDAWPQDREGRPLAGLQTTGKAPKVVVTFVIDGGGWNALRQWPKDWPTLGRLMREGATYRNAIVGSFPAVTACAHATIGTGTFPRTHGITGHNIRDGAEVRKAYRSPGEADPGDILVPTLADLHHDATGAWVGEIGYQVWHLGMLGRGGSDRPPGDLPVAVYWDEDGTRSWRPHNPDLYRLPSLVPGLDVLEGRQAAFTAPDWDREFDPKGKQAVCCSPPIIGYQGDLIEATFLSEPIGRGDTTDLLYINFKSPDYTGHIYNMLSPWEGLVLNAVDTEIARLIDLLDERFPGEYVLFVTADHGQCPLPDAVGGVRVDPIQLEREIEGRFGGGVTKVVQSVVPSEVYLHTDALWDAGATSDDVAAHLRHLTYRQNIGPYVPRDAIEQDLLDREEFAAVFATTYLGSMGAPARFGATTYTGEEIDFGIPPRSLYA